MTNWQFILLLALGALAYWDLRSRVSWRKKENHPFAQRARLIRAEYASKGQSVLYHGSAQDTGDQLDYGDGPFGPQELHSALINALRKIVDLQENERFLTDAEMKRPLPHNCADTSDLRAILRRIDSLEKDAAKPKETTS